MLSSVQSTSPTPSRDTVSTSHDSERGGDVFAELMAVAGSDDRSRSHVTEAEHGATDKTSVEDSVAGEGAQKVDPVHGGDGASAGTTETGAAEVQRPAALDAAIAATSTAGLSVGDGAAPSQPPAVSTGTPAAGTSAGQGVTSNQPTTSAVPGNVQAPDAAGGPSTEAGVPASAAPSSDINLPPSSSGPGQTPNLPISASTTTVAEAAATSAELAAVDQDSTKGPASHPTTKAESLPAASTPAAQGIGVAADVALPVNAPVDPSAPTAVSPTSPPGATPSVPQVEAAARASTLTQAIAAVDRLVAAAAGREVNTVTLRLSPEALGDLRVTLRQGALGMTLSIAGGPEAIAALSADSRELNRLLAPYSISPTDVELTSWADSADLGRNTAGAEQHAPDGRSPTGDADTDTNSLRSVLTTDVDSPVAAARAAVPLGDRRIDILS